MKGNARALMSRGVEESGEGGGASSKAAAIYTLKVCFAALLHAHIAVTLHPDSALQQQHLYLCVPAAAFPRPLRFTTRVSRLHFNPENSAKPPEDSFPRLVTTRQREAVASVRR